MKTIVVRYYHNIFPAKMKVLSDNKQKWEAG